MLAAVYYSSVWSEEAGQENMVGVLGDPEATLSFDDSLGPRQDVVVAGVVYYSDGIQTKSTRTKAPRAEPRGNPAGASFPFSVGSHAQINTSAPPIM